MEGPKNTLPINQTPVLDNGAGLGFTAPAPDNGAGLGFSNMQQSSGSSQEGPHVHFDVNALGATSSGNTPPLPITGLQSVINLVEQAAQQMAGGNNNTPLSAGNMGIPLDWGNPGPGGFVVEGGGLAITPTPTSGRSVEVEGFIPGIPELPVSSRQSRFPTPPPEDGISTPLGWRKRPISPSYEDEVVTGRDSPDGYPVPTLPFKEHSFLRPKNDGDLSPLGERKGVDLAPAEVGDKLALTPYTKPGFTVPSTNWDHFSAWFTKTTNSMTN